MEHKPPRPVGIVRTEADYDAAMLEFESYFDNEPAPGSPEADRFELLGLVLARYEEQNMPIETPTPLNALKFRMEQAGYTQTDLAKLLGSRSRASEILNGKRGLNLDQIRLLAREWGIPPAVLVGEPAAA